jgi:hypothetical protein
MDSVFAGWSKPATASISRPVTTTDIGDERSPATGCSARVALICGRRSGEALRTSQYARRPSPQAKPATARSRRLPARPGTQMRCSSTAGNPHRPQTEHNRINMGCLAGSAGLRKRRDYLISAQAYALISSPTAISMMTGVFHFIAVFLDLILAGGKSRVVRWRRRSGGWESRETAALRLGTAGEAGDCSRRTGTRGICVCGDDSGQKRRSQNRRFAKSEH